MRCCYVEMNGKSDTNHVKAIASIRNRVNEPLDAIWHRLKVLERVEDGKSGNSWK